MATVASKIEYDLFSKGILINRPLGEDFSDFIAKLGDQLQRQNPLDVVRQFAETRQPPEDVSDNTKLSQFTHKIAKNYQTVGERQGNKTYEQDPAYQFIDGVKTITFTEADILNSVEQGPAFFIEELGKALNASIDPDTYGATPEMLKLLGLSAQTLEEASALDEAKLLERVEALSKHIQRSSQSFEKALAEIRAMGSEPSKEYMEHLATIHADNSILLKNLPEIVAGSVDMLRQTLISNLKLAEELTAKTTDDPNKDPFGWFARIGIDIVQGEVRIVDDKPFFAHLSFEEMHNALDKREIEIQMALMANAGNKEKCEALTKAQESIQAARDVFSTEAKYEEKLAQYANKAADMKARYEALISSDKLVVPLFEEIEAANPNLSRQELDELILNTAEEYGRKKVFYSAYKMLNTSFHARATNEEVETGYKTYHEYFSNPEIQRLIGVDKAQEFLKALEAAKAMLLDPVQRDEYDKKERADRQKFERYYLRAKSRAMMDEMADYRKKARDKFLEREGTSMLGLERFLHSIDWLSFAGSSAGQQAIVGLYVLNGILASPWGALGATTVVLSFPVLASAAPAMIFLTGALGYASKYGWEGMTPWHSGVDFLYDQCKQQADIPFLTRFTMDMQGHRTIFEKAGIITEMQVSYLLDFQSKFGDEYTEDLVFEIIRDRFLTRFSDDLFSINGQDMPHEAEVRAKLEEKSIGFWRYQLVMGELFPPVSVLSDEALGGRTVQRISDSMWNEIVADDPEFIKMFVVDTNQVDPVTGQKIYAPNQQKLDDIFKDPTDLFEARSDWEKLGLAAPFIGLGEVMYAAKQAQLIEVRRLKRRSANQFQVGSLAHKIANARNYQTSILSEKSADDMINQNMKEMGIADGKTDKGFVPGIASSEVMVGSPLLFAVHRRRNPKMYDEE